MAFENDLSDTPAALAYMRGDPYRNSAGAVCKKGGFAKSDAPFLEFLWSNHFRQRISRTKLVKHFDKAVRQGIKLALSAESNYLPGYSGRTEG